MKGIGLLISTLLAVIAVLLSYEVFDVSGQGTQWLWFPGQLYYLMSKVCSLFALAIIVLQLFMVPIKWLTKIEVPRLLHKRLGLLVLVLIIFHVGLFFSAVWIRNGHPPMGLLVPSFSAGYYKAGLSFGLIALGVLIFAVVRVPRLKGGIKRLTRHRLVLVATSLGVVHAYMIGSETQYVTALGAAVLVMMVVLALYVFVPAMKLRINGNSFNRVS